MDRRLTVVTLGVRDIERSRQFYVDGLGWRTAAGSNEHILFLDMGGVVLALYGVEHLADDACLKVGTGFGGGTLAQNVRSPGGVGAALAQAVAAGGEMLKAGPRGVWGGGPGGASGA